MTCIAWDGKSLSADKRAAHGGMVRTVTKIRKIGKLLCGVCGDFGLAQDVFAWVERGRDVNDYPVCQYDKDEWVGLLVIDNGKILKYERSPRPIIFENTTYAIGSGRDYALAAMHCGKTSAEAIEVASYFDIGCGNGVDTIRLSK